MAQVPLTSKSKKMKETCAENSYHDKVTQKNLGETSANPPSLSHVRPTDFEKPGQTHKQTNGELRINQ